jgi:hypothetical protein
MDIGIGQMLDVTTDNPTIHSAFLKHFSFAL